MLPLLLVVGVVSLLVNVLMADVINRIHFEYGAFQSSSVKGKSSLCEASICLRMASFLATVIIQLGSKHLNLIFW